MHMTTKIKVAAIQQSKTSNYTKNIENTIQDITLAAKQGAQLIVLQELHNSLYFCQIEEVGCFDLAETIPGTSTDRFGKLAKSLGVVIVISIFEKRAAGLYHNTAVVLENDGSIAGTYRKMHIPDDPGFYEKFYFTPGDKGFEPINTSVGRLGVLVCWDQWFPEAARLMAMAGAEMLIYPTAIGWDPADDSAEQQRQRNAWMIIQRSHAVANGIPVISCNRVGHEHDPSKQSLGIQFWGNSFISGPQGELLAQAGSEQAEILLSEVSMQRCEQVRRIWPFLRDRRIDSYQDLGKLYRD